MGVEIRHVPARGQDVLLLDRRSLALFERVGEVGLEEVEAILEAGETAADAADYLAERYHIDSRRDQRRIINVARRRLQPSLRALILRGQARHEPGSFRELDSRHRRGVAGSGFCDEIKGSGKPRKEFPTRDPSRTAGERSAEQERVCRGLSHCLRSPEVAAPSG